MIGQDWSHDLLLLVVEHLTLLYGDIPAMGKYRLHTNLLEQQSLI